MKSIFIVFMISALLVACSPRHHSERRVPAGAVALSDIQGEFSDIETVNMLVSRKELKRAMALPLSSGVRIVQIHERSGGEVPKYRLFEIREGSALHTLGLRNADVLIASHGYVIFDPGQFMNYVRYLADQDEGSVIITRNGRPLQFSYKIRE